MILDLKSKLRVSRALSPQSSSDNTALVSQIATVDCADGIMLAILTGSLGDAGAEWTVLLEHASASDMSGAEAVPDEYLVGTEAGASFIQSDDNVVKTLGYIGPKPYIRATITPTNNATAALVSAVWIKGLGRKGCNTSQDS